MWGGARPASGAEHMVAHVWELGLFAPDSGSLHGEMVGVGTLKCKELYEKFIETVGDNPREVLVEYKGFPHEMLREKLGENVYAELTPYNEPDEGKLVDYEKLVAGWDEIRGIFAQTPTARDMEKLFRDSGVKATMQELGLPDEILPATLEVGSFVRGRITLLRIWERFTNLK
jgi:glycerol-1-phosphate dehydrogenase [NAD(P)+]